MNTSDYPDLHIRVHPELMAKVRKRAEEYRRSLNTTVSILLENALDDLEEWEEEEEDPLCECANCKKVTPFMTELAERLGKVKELDGNVLNDGQAIGHDGSSA